ncbi:MAG: hypothetical protein ACPG85_04675, partial [Flavobacteriales bacterium]
LEPDAGDCFGPLSCFGGDGEYVISVTDQAGCSTDTAITIACPEELFFDVSSTEVSCTGYSDASFAASAAGGTGSVSFEVPEIGVQIDFEGSVDYDQDNLPSGIYTFTLTDENGCSYSEVLEKSRSRTASWSITQ